MAREYKGLPTLANRFYRQALGLNVPKYDSLGERKLWRLVFAEYELLSCRSYQLLNYYYLMNQ
jgi:hypothetical protein